MKLRVEPYRDQVQLWPSEGRQILAQFDGESIIVYQAYNPEIGRFAAEHGHFGGGFSYSRMSWIKPNFLWLMYRSGWGTKAGQEVTLAVRLSRRFFDSLLAQAVPSSFAGYLYQSQDEWRRAVADSDVRLQWDPDHSPTGAPLPRRAIQLGLRGAALEAFGRRELLEVADVSQFVAEQRQFAVSSRLSELHTPAERVYIPADPQIGHRLGLGYAAGDHGEVS